MPDFRTIVGIAQVVIAAAAAAIAAGLVPADAETVALILAVQNALTGGRYVATPGAPPPSDPGPSN